MKTLIPISFSVYRRLRQVNQVYVSTSTFFFNETRIYFTELDSSSTLHSWVTFSPSLWWSFNLSCPSLDSKTFAPPSAPSCHRTQGDKRFVSNAIVHEWKENLLPNSQWSVIVLVLFCLHHISSHLTHTRTHTHTHTHILLLPKSQTCCFTLQGRLLPKHFCFTTLCFTLVEHSLPCLLSLVPATNDPFHPFFNQESNMFNAEWKPCRCVSVM